MKGVFSPTTLFLFTTFFSFMLISSVLAADVAYIYKKDLTVQQNVIDTFNEAGLSVELVSENHLPTDFSQYKIIFVGDEKIAENEKIPIDKHASIISSYYNIPDFGLTDAEGASQLGATSPLTVVKGNEPIQVYDRAFERGKIALPYYFLDKKNKAESLISVASARETSSGQRFGDVISYAPTGTILYDGRMTEDEICFFGIIESKYWTPEAKELFNECIKFTLSDCQNSNDCPSPSFTDDPFCLGNDIFQNEVSFTCVRDGYAGKCTPQQYNVLMDTCEFACSAGECIRCDENSDCNDGIYRTDDICTNPGTSESYCENLPITCFNNSECGTDDFVGELYCSNDLTIAQLFQTFTCNNPATGGSYCTSTETEEQIQTCEDVCIDGECQLFECETNSECNDNNSSTEDTCLEPSTLNSYCSNEPIACFENSDCGTDGFIGLKYCQTEMGVGQFYETFTCNNPGTAESHCTSETTEQQTETCTDLCENGACVEVACFTNADCGTDGFISEPFCSNQSVMQTLQTNLCISPGNSSSYCDINLSDLLITECPEQCVNGTCQPTENE